MRHRAFLLILFFMLSGCGLFSDKKKEVVLADLPALPEQSVKLKKLWSKSIGDIGEEEAGFNLNVYIEADRIYAANSSGRVYAINRYSGDVIWTASLDVLLQGSVGAGSDMVFVADEMGVVHALSAQNGAALWQAQATSEVLARSVTDGSVVVVQSVDSKVQAFDVSTGARRWIYSATQSVLTLRGNSAPVIQGGIVYVAFDNGKTTAIDLRTGLPRWEQRFVIPDGRSELERVIDVQADPLVTGSSVFIGAYQGALVGLDNDTGSIQWQEKASVSRSMALLDDHSALAYVEDGDIVRVLSLNGGGQIWQADLFDNRRLTSPAIAGGIVAVADQQGYIHLLDADSGQYAGRYNLSSSGVRMDLVGVGQVLYVLANDGYLYAFDVSR